MKYFLLVLFFASVNTLNAQFYERTLEGSPKKNARIVALQNQTIELPFWDDFATSNGTLDTAWWTPQSQLQVIVKTGIGINPPSLGVVSFDGIDALGQPYLPGPTDGGVDSLVSHYIDLTKVPTGLRNTVYLSFFYQFYGLGESPEEQDSLILYFKNVDGQWDKIWPKIGDNYASDPTVFTEVFAQVNGTQYFHPEFQFMIKATGRQNGWLDNWLVDYVYMDKRRFDNDNSYLDRAFTQPPSSIFDQYTSIPFDDFVAAVDKDVLFKPTQTKLRNLENDLQPVEYSVNLYDTINDVLIEQITTDQSLLLFQKDLVSISSQSLDPTLLDINADSLYLMLEYSVSSGDKLLIDSIYNSGLDTTFYSHINLRQNDTLRSYFNLHNYYAYDDGTAEYGAGFNQPQGKIAVQFNVLKGKYLNRIDIYFPNIQGNQAGLPLELFVLNDFEGNENSVRFQSNIAISHTGINEFITYKLASPIFVTDTFFIGFTNLSSTQDWLGVGLDKNTDSSDKIFVNVDGTWTPNNTVQGSLMMRPYFVKDPPILGIKKDESVVIDVYPNPSNGRLHIDGSYKSINLINVLGKPVTYEVINQDEIRFKVNSPQVLILLIETNSGMISKRIMATPSTQ
ncbi:MAG: T9SS type A sorting domain-containing protein [Cyclobacteriaceae bacterium]|nr:T9SS type A sorting domain-containing protein [Cyclobacteriaceae bacterium]